MSAKSASESQFDHIDPSTLALLFSAKLCSLLLRQNNNSEKSVAKVFVLVAAEIESCERFGSDRRQNSNKRQKLRIMRPASECPDLCVTCAIILAPAALGGPCF